MLTVYDDNVLYLDVIDHNGSPQNSYGTKELHGWRPTYLAGYVLPIKQSQNNSTSQSFVIDSNHLSMQCLIKDAAKMIAGSQSIEEYWKTIKWKQR